uniref:Dirigent protein n=1 Tax=Ananas comosus var. bracteatus TaxID=296719 RepID=A0A6V7P189_ANACO|nr:unnamed protein product [Ananas comosus var. bracteatus]
MASLYSFVCYHHLLLFLLAAAVAAALTTHAAADDVTHLHFYMHDILGGSNPTAVEIVKAPLRCLPSLASTSEASLLVSVNFVLATDGPYNGSVVSVQGRDPIAAPVRELSVVGGIGQFSDGPWVRALEDARRQHHQRCSNPEARRIRHGRVNL